MQCGLHEWAVGHAAGGALDGIGLATMDDDAADALGTLAVANDLECEVT